MLIRGPFSGPRDDKGLNLRRDIRYEKEGVNEMQQRD
jgi:hypothetical protein